MSMDDMEKEKTEFLVIPGNGSNRSRAGAARSNASGQLSRTVKKINQQAVQWLQSRIEDVFTHVDDSLFSMAEKVHLQEEQDRLFQTIRELRVEQSGLVDGFCDGIEDRFYTPRNDTPGEEVALKAAPSLKSLSLVGDDDLEQQVAIRTMVANIKRDHAEAIAALSLRLDTLLPHKIYDENLPLGPASICAAFAESLESIELPLRARMTILKKFEVHLVNHLGELYDACNTLLVSMGVLPMLEDPLRLRGRNRGGPVPSSPVPPATSGIPGQPGQPAGMGDAAGYAGNYPSAGAGFAATGMPAGVAGSPAGVAGGQFVPGLAPIGAGVAPMGTPMLLQHLSQLQVAMPLQSGAAGQLIDVRGMLQERLVENKQSASLQELDSEVIRLVDMLFSFMLEDRNLAEPIKAQLIRLQLPMLKLAVADKAFFSKGGHPARRLLNELADAAIGWQQGAEYERDPLYRKICSIVESVLEEFAEDETIFGRLLESFREFSTRERKRAAVLERRTVDEAQGAARVEAAKARVAAVFDALTAERELPKVVYEWLNRVWNSVLFRTCLKEGTGSGEWRQHVLTARDLIWSVVAPMPESRVKMQRLLPDLRRRLDAGAQSLSLSPGDRQRLMGGLDVLYRERHALAQRVESERERRIRERLVQELRREADSIVAIPEVDDGPVAPGPVELAGVAAEAPAGADEARELPESQPALPDVDSLEQVASKAVAAKSVAAPSQPKGDEHWQQTYHLKDSWFLVREEGKLPMRCRLAAIITDLDQFMFVNRNGAKVAVYSRLELANSLREGVLLPLEQGPLFERALRHVVGEFGDSKLEIKV